MVVIQYQHGQNTYFSCPDTVSLPFCARYHSTTTIFTPPSTIQFSLSLFLPHAWRGMGRSLSPSGTAGICSTERVGGADARSNMESTSTELAILFSWLIPRIAGACRAVDICLVCTCIK